MRLVGACDMRALEETGQLCDIGRLNNIGALAGMGQLNNIGQLNNSGATAIATDTAEVSALLCPAIHLSAGRLFVVPFGDGQAYLIRRLPALVGIRIRPAHGREIRAS